WERSPSGKWTKVPYQPDQPRIKASSTNSETWGRYGTALRVYQQRRADGIGYCLHGSGLGAFDLDVCRDPTSGVITPMGLDLVRRVGSYTEITVSGSGLRIIGRAGGAKIHRKDNDSGLRLETYRDAERYIVVTANPLPNTPGRLVNIDRYMDEIV